MRKTLLYRTGFGGWCINHIEGCSHGCMYPCYAMLIKEKSGAIKDYEDWIRPKIVSNALELLDAELRRKRKKPQSVHLCFSTDPFMHGYAEVTEGSLKIIEKLNSCGIPCSTLSKGVHPADKLTGEGFSKDNSHGITVVSIDEGFRREFEPGAAPIKDRIDALRKLSGQGLSTYICMEPYPTPNIFKQDLKKILEAVSFADEIIFGRLNYNPSAKGFKHHKEFYQSQAQTVRKFCNSRKINCMVMRDTR